jgi:polyhydroxyalkanoate synthase
LAYGFDKTHAILSHVNCTHDTGKSVTRPSKSAGLNGLAKVTFAVALSPERQKEMSLAAFGGAVAASLADAEEDKRFAHPLWSLPPYTAFKTGFLAAQNWWMNALAPMSGFDTKHQRALEFYARQALDMWCPTNSPITNPVVAAKAIETSGESLQQGWKNWLDDLGSTLTGHPRPAPGYVLGETLAVTPGDVVYRNRLIEVIRYHPTQKKRRGPPIFIAPACMHEIHMYVFSPSHSLAR